MSRELNKLKQPFQDQVKKLLKLATDQGLPVFITETTRTLAKQKEYVAKGVSWTLKSKHLIGEAVDLAFTVNGKLSYDAGLYNKLYNISKDLDFIIWPYKDLGWKVDKPHFEYDPKKKGAEMDCEIERVNARADAMRFAWESWNPGKKVNMNAIYAEARDIEAGKKNQKNLIMGWRKQSLESDNFMTRNNVKKVIDTAFEATTDLQKQIIAISKNYNKLQNNYNLQSERLNQFILSKASKLTITEHLRAIGRYVLNFLGGKK